MTARRLATSLPWLVLLAATPPPNGPGLYYAEWLQAHGRDAEPEPRELRLINYFFTRGTYTNQVADPAGLRGVSLGPLGIGEGAGSATRVDSDTTVYIEQRWIPVLSYSPNFSDGLATFRGQFEVDFTWGQAANQIQNNQGGGLNADQVNIQTKNVNVALYPFKSPGPLAVVIGSQPMYDNVADPTVTSLFDIVQTGYKLAYLGTDGTGLSVYSRLFPVDHTRWKLTFLPIGAAQPDKATDNDPRLAYVYLLMADVAHHFAPTTEVGLSLWHLRDDTAGRAFAFEGLVPSGPGSSGLFAYTGVPNFDLEEPNGHVTWVGAHFNHDVGFRTGDLAASGFVMANFGRYESQKADTALNPTLRIAGLGANLELAFNYGRALHGRSLGDVVSLEGMFSTGDSDVKDGEYTGAFTLNNYGLPGAVWFNHKTLILFPFTSTVSNYTGAVTDISNQGYGLLAAIVAARKDLVMNTLNLKLGAAYAQSAVAPPPTVDFVKRGRTLGAEVNAELTWNIRYLMTLGLHGAYMSTGNFFDGNLQMDEDPVAVFTTFTWYGF